MSPPFRWLREGELKQRLGMGNQSKISIESTKTVGKEWEREDVKQHKGEPQAKEEAGKGRHNPSIDYKVQGAVGTSEQRNRNKT